MNGPRPAATEAVAVRAPGSRAGESLSWGDTGALVAALVRRDLALHYRHTRLGMLWAILPPLVAAGALDLFLGRLGVVGAPRSGVPTTAFLYAGLLPWQFFARAATSGVGCMLGNSWILSQVAFPRIVLPLSTILTGLPDLLLGSVVLFGMLVVVGHAPGAGLLWAPIAFVPLVLLAAAAAFLLSALTVVLRDVQHATPYATRLLLLASPVLYPLAETTGTVRGVLLANPLTGALEAYRAAWLSQPVDLALLGASCAGAALLCAGALWVFRRLEHRFGDLL